MLTSEIYIIISVIILIVVAIVVYSLNKNRKIKKLNGLDSLSIGFILAGIYFGEERIIGYSLIGIGIILTVTNAMNNLRSK
jgi:hypothetical protein